MITQIKVALLMISITVVFSPIAHSQSSDELKMIMMENYLPTNPDEIKWERVKSAKWGMRMVKLVGDPAESGPYVYRIKMPAGYKMPPHVYEEGQSITVLKGTYWTGIGKKTDPMSLREFNPGGFFIIKGGAPRYTWARTEVILQISGQGPSKLNYVFEGDDPRKR